MGIESVHECGQGVMRCGGVCDVCVCGDSKCSWRRSMSSQCQIGLTEMNASNVYTSHNATIWTLGDGHWSDGGEW